MEDAESASGSSTPASRFRSQGVTTEDQLKTSTVGLVTLSDFRKRRAEALEAGDSGASGSTTPTGDDTVKFVKKKRKLPKKGGLSFGDDDDVAAENGTDTTAPSSSRQSPAPPSAPDSARSTTPRLAANAAVGFIAKSQTKAALAREAQIKEALRKEYAALQARVRATPFVLPFAFFDGADSEGGVCRVTKGEQVWRFLERARKRGAEASRRGLKQWARISVDDLMLVVDDIVIPHHYEFHYFMQNKTRGFTRALFPYAAEPTAATPATLETEEPAQQQGGLTFAGESRSKDPTGPVIPDAELEGFDDDPSLIKVVDRRWYERNKHVFPMSAWQDFDPEKDYASGPRTDAQGNAYFNR